MSRVLSGFVFATLISNKLSTPVRKTLLTLRRERGFSEVHFSGCQISVLLFFFIFLSLFFSAVHSDPFHHSLYLPQNTLCSSLFKHGLTAFTDTSDWAIELCYITLSHCDFEASDLFFCYFMQDTAFRA